jgi:hypothetical protein
MYLYSTLLNLQLTCNTTRNIELNLLVELLKKLLPSSHCQFKCIYSSQKCIWKQPIYGICSEYEENARIAVPYLFLKEIHVHCDSIKSCVCLIGDYWYSAASG